MQTFTDFECIVIDDGSNDDSHAVIEQWIDDDRFHLYHQENAGVALTRNRGIELAEGEFLTFVDQDDYVAPEYLEHMMLLMDDETEIVISGYRREDEDGKLLQSVTLNEGSWSKFVVVTPWARIFRKDFIKKNNIRFLKTNFGEDVYFNMMAYLRTDKVRVLVHNDDYCWFFNKDSVSNTIHKKVSKNVSPVILLNAIMSNIPERPMVPYEDFEYYIIRFCIWYILNVMKSSSLNENKRVQSELYNWLNKHFSDYRKNVYIHKCPDGEKKKYHVAVKYWILFNKTGLDKCITFALSKR